MLASFYDRPSRREPCNDRWQKLASSQPGGRALPFRSTEQNSAGEGPDPGRLVVSGCGSNAPGWCQPYGGRAALDGGKWQHRIAASGRAARNEPPVAFVELLAPGQARSRSHSPESTLERIGKLQIHVQVQAATAPELAILSRALWDLVR